MLIIINKLEIDKKMNKEMNIKKQVFKLNK